MDLLKLRELMELMHEQGAHYVKTAEVEIALAPRVSMETGVSISDGQGTKGHHSRTSAGVPSHFDPDLYRDGIVPGMSIDQARSTVVDG